MDAIDIPARDISRSPSLSPTPAISSCPSPDRTFSTVSSISNFSGDVRSSSMSASTAASSRRRGYIRPQGATFADSAKNRESVMSLGSIAHLQYYFARTGLLDGKGAQMAKARKSPSDADIPKLTLSQQTHLGGDLVESPIEGLAEFGDGAAAAGWEEEDEEHEPLMLPPTVSTYSIRTHHIPPPPDLRALRQDLQTALEKARHVLTASKEELAAQKKAASELATESAETTESYEADETEEEAEEVEEQQQKTPKKQTKGWDEVEGMHILDLVTLAIRAARIYYTAHEHPERLALIKSERQIRGELLSVLDVLKRWAARSFAGGLRERERTAILDWIDGVNAMLQSERALEARESHRRKSWTWTSGDWEGREREREYQFLQNLPSAAANPLPPWEPVDEQSQDQDQEQELPTAFLARLRDGRDLVRFHNEAVRLSHRQFGAIKAFHDDIGKPYRMADNLRYWVKAAEIRWEIRLEVDVMGIVAGDSPAAWRAFDAAVLQWCRGVREELLRDWSSREAAGDAKTDSSSLSPYG